MEAKLREFRARQRRQEIIESVKEKVDNTKNKLFNNIFGNMNKEKTEEKVSLLDIEEEEAPPRFIPLQTEDPTEAADPSDTAETESIVDETEESWRYCILKWSIYAIIWVTMYAYFLKVGFGAVFFVISALVFIYINTRTRRKKPGEISAYSVFNEDCQKIDGTLDAEQLQRQMIYGAGSLGLF